MAFSTMKRIRIDKGVSFIVRRELYEKMVALSNFGYEGAVTEASKCLENDESNQFVRISMFVLNEKIGAESIRFDCEP